MCHNNLDWDSSVKCKHDDDHMTTHHHVTTATNGQVMEITRVADDIATHPHLPIGGPRPPCLRLVHTQAVEITKELILNGWAGEWADVI